MLSRKTIEDFIEYAQEKKDETSDPFFIHAIEIATDYLIDRDLLKRIAESRPIITIGDTTFCVWCGGYCKKGAELICKRHCLWHEINLRVSK